MTPAIQTRGLAKQYRRVSALRDCSITVPQERIAALIGPNGAGKTTLLRLLAGLAKPTAGEVAVLGGTPRQDPAFLAEIGFLAQEIPLYRRGHHVLQSDRRLHAARLGLAARVGHRRPGRPAGPAAERARRVQHPLNYLPASCAPLNRGTKSAASSCLQALAHFRGFVTYQPGGRYWAFQGIETGIFVLLAAVLLGVTAVVLLRRDA